MEATKQTQVPQTNKQKSKVRIATCLSAGPLAAPNWPQNPAATYKDFQSCQLQSSIYPLTKTMDICFQELKKKRFWYTLKT